LDYEVVGLLDPDDVVESPDPKDDVVKSSDPDDDPTKRIPGFPDPDKDPQSYVDRYTKEESYKKWFDSNFPDYSIYEVVGLTDTTKKNHTRNGLIRTFLIIAFMK